MTDSDTDRLFVDRRGSTPEFVVERLSLYGAPLLGVTCQRGDCKQTHYVDEPEWRESMSNPTRPCPYCFRVSRIPEVSPNG